MSSLALLAHAAAPPPPAFNGLFYATAATVIPVLFLAIAVQGRTYENLVNAGTAADRRLSEATTWRRRTIAYVSGSVLFVIAGLILVWGVLSEIIAVAALHQQQASGAAGFIVLIGTIFMVIAAAGPPALVFARYAWAPAGELAKDPADARRGRSRHRAGLTRTRRYHAARNGQNGHRGLILAGM